MSNHYYGVSNDASDPENEPVNEKQSALENDEAYQCRFYRRNFPEKEEIVPDGTLDPLDFSNRVSALL